MICCRVNILLAVAVAVYDCNDLDLNCYNNFIVSIGMNNNNNNNYH